ncbi:MAG: DNA cytosine methyltransferase [Sulfitobacter sp.]|nr:DNA cytosine methyltransferase [Sulfitobacter sp.]
MTTAASLFCGIGGLDLGAALAGCDVRLGIDSDRDAVELHNKTFGGTSQVSDLGARKISLSDAWPLPSAPDLVIGGPPCTGFSHAGFWIDKKRNSLDPASELLGKMVDAARELRPRAVVVENVPGLAFRNHRHRLDSLVNRLRAAGYATTWGILNSAQFGVAQARRRLFVVGILEGPPLDLNGWPPFPQRSAGWALKNVQASPEPGEVPQGSHGYLLPEVPLGGNYLHFTAERGYDKPKFQYRSRYWSFLLKLDPSAPSPTIPASRVTFNGPFHWENRHLRSPELARLQGFPDWFPLDSDHLASRRHIGNAVPPLLAGAVIDRVLDALGEERSERSPILVNAKDRRLNFEQVWEAPIPALQPKLAEPV